jgi:hypothetical protein
MPRKATPKQQKLVRVIRENAGRSKPQPMGKLLLEAGYSRGSAKNPQDILKAAPVQLALQKELDTLEMVSRAHLSQLMSKKKLSGASARTNAYVYDVMTKNRQLLSGKATSNVGIRIELSQSIAGKNVPEVEKTA